MIIGIDPGQSGGIAGLDRRGLPVFISPMPVIDKKVDVAEVQMLLDLYEPELVVIEQQSIMNGQKGAMAIGSNYGRLMAMIELARLAHREVSPPKWKGWLKITDASMTTRQKKEKAYHRAVQVFGKNLDGFRSVGPTKDGPVEAALIAYFGWATIYAPYATKDFTDD